MRIGILEAGEPPAALQPAYGTYGAMTRRLVGPDHVYETFRVVDGHFPDGADEFDAFVVTGSASGVMDGAAWIDELADFLRLARGKAKLVGICFGHQVMAHAFGGQVSRASQGWALGLRRYEIKARAPWMDAAEAIVATASHRDQVVRLPPRALVLGGNDFTAHAILAYEDHPAISFQFHPEFEPDFSRALFDMRRAPDLSDALRSAAITSLAGANDNVRLAGWIRRFLQG